MHPLSNETGGNLKPPLPHRAPHRGFEDTPRFGLDDAQVADRSSRIHREFDFHIPLDAAAPRPGGIGWRGLVHGHDEARGALRSGGLGLVCSGSCRSSSTGRAQAVGRLRAPNGGHPSRGSLRWCPWRTGRARLLALAHLARCGSGGFDHIRLPFGPRPPMSPGPKWQLTVYTPVAFRPFSCFRSVLSPVGLRRGDGFRVWEVGLGHGQREPEPP